MKRALTILFALMLGFTFAQRSISLAGVIDSEEGLPDDTRLSVQVLNADGAWSYEVDSVAPIGGSFELEVGEVPAEHLRPFRSGAVLLPGLQNEYRVTPEDANYVQGTLAMYLDEDQDGTWTREPERDPFFLALSQLEQPIGFFTLIYVDQAATMEGRGEELALAQGWNVFTVRFPESGPAYEIREAVDDIALEVLDLLPR
ncbi:MAG: hypothetical protein U5K81_03740 [Trueperaceae bacterium]|nr:hypothetical protein [Trueperaceae bacterium]